MAYLSIRDIVAMALFAALWGVLSARIAPIIFNIFRIPIFCDMVGFACLMIVVWWVRKLGAASIVGIVATIINLVLNPYATHFLGFTAASVVFDVLTWVFRYDDCFSKKILGAVFLFIVSVVSAAVAGFIIGTFFMTAPQLVSWDVIGWVMLHMAGGIVGWLLGVIIVLSLEARGIRKK